MSDVLIPINPGTGSQSVDFAQESTTSALRQIITVGDPTTKAAQAEVINSNPGTSDYGLVTRPISSASLPTYVTGTVADAASSSGNPLPIGGVYNSSAPTYTTGQRTTLQTDSNGYIKVNLSTTAALDNTNSLIKVGGNIASGSADSQNPVKVGARYNASAPTFSDGNRTDLQADVNGNLKVTLATVLASLVAGVETDSILVHPGRRADAFQATKTSASSSAQTVQSGTSSKSIYVTNVTISCDGGAACNVIIQDSAGTPNVLVNKTFFGTTPTTVSMKFDCPLQVAAGNSLNYLCSSATPNITVTAVGYVI